MATGISRLLGAPPGSAQQPTQVKALVLPRATKEETTEDGTAGDTQPGEGKATEAEPKEGEPAAGGRSEEHTSELQSLMRISYAVFCLKKKKRPTSRNTSNTKRYT